MKSDVLIGAAAGAAGGIAGAAAMVIFNHLLAGTGFGRHDLGVRKQHRHIHGKPNETDGTIADEPASEQVAGKLVEAMTGEELGDRGKKIGGTLGHYLFGAAAGALYGAAVSRVPRLGAAAGVPYGAFVWVTAVEMALPLSGFAKRPTEYRAERHLASLGTHIVFGVTLEGVRRWMTRTIR